MLRLLLVACVLLSASAVSAGSVRGVLVNGDDPYIVKAANGSIYKCEWLGGSIGWFPGDSVLLTNNLGTAQMVKLGGIERTAKVFVEEQ